jgi:hypothetical protein
MTLNYDNYKNKLTYPKKVDYTFYNHYANGKFLGKSKSRDGDENCPKGAVVEKVVYDEYYADSKAYRDETARLDELFKQDVLSLLGIADHPKADKLFDMAWEDCHSEGLEAVASRCEELAELLS